MQLHNYKKFLSSKFTELYNYQFNKWCEHFKNKYHKHDQTLSNKIQSVQFHQQLHKDYNCIKTSKLESTIINNQISWACGLSVHFIKQVYGEVPVIPW